MDLEHSETLRNILKTFEEFMQLRELGQPMPGTMPNMGQQAVPAQGQQPQQIMPQQRQHAGSDPNWIHLNSTFERMSKQNANDPNVASLGSALQQAKQSGNMSVLQPFIQMYTQQGQQSPNMGQQAPPMRQQTPPMGQV